MKESMGKMGVRQGDMSPKVEEYQKPESNFCERGFSKTLDYIERHNKFEGKEAKEVKKQAYMGRYS